MKTMKTLKQYLVLLLLGTFILSCSSDEEPPVVTDEMPEEEMMDPVDPEETSDLVLNFTTETEEDQIGQFASNAMVEYNDNVWVVGGHVGFGPPYFTQTNQVWRSENGRNWLSVSVDQFPARSGHTLTVINDRMYMIGGVNFDTSELFNDIWSSTDGLIWTLEEDAAVFGDISNHTVTSFNGRWYLIYGSSVWSSLNGLDWTLETDTAFESRNNHKTVVFNNELYVVGGLTTDASALNEIWKSSDAIQWEQVTPTGDIFQPRSNHTLTVYNNKAFLIAGRDGTTIYRDIYYSEDMTHWTSYELEEDADGSSDGLYSHNILLYNDAMWLFGGYNSSGASSEIQSIKEEE